MTTDLVQRLRAADAALTAEMDAWQRTWNAPAPSRHQANTIAVLREAADALEAQAQRVCGTCRYRGIDPDDGAEWCGVAPDGASVAELNTGLVGVANWRCDVVGHCCGAWQERGE